MFKQSVEHGMLTKKPFTLKGLRGTEQIRTAVGGFADLSLASRPRYRFNFRFSVLDLDSETAANISRFFRRL
jgi:hypothetical protein